MGLRISFIRFRQCTLVPGAGPSRRLLDWPRYKTTLAGRCFCAYRFCSAPRIVKLCKLWRCSVIALLLVVCVFLSLSAPGQCCATRDEQAGHDSRSAAKGLEHLISNHQEGHVSNGPTFELQVHTAHKMRIKMLLTMRIPSITAH